EVVVPRKANGAITAGLDTRAAQAALGEVQAIRGNGLALGALRLDAVQRDAIARAGLLAELAHIALGLARRRVAHELDMAAKPRRNLQRLVRITHRHRRPEKLAECDLQPDKKALEAVIDFKEGFLHNFTNALERIRVNSETGMRIFQERFNSP